MAGNSGKKSKSKPTRLTEFFQSSQDADRSMQTSATTLDLSLTTDSPDQDISYVAIPHSFVETSLQGLFQNFRQQL